LKPARHHPPKQLHSEEISEVRENAARAGLMALVTAACCEQRIAGSQQSWWGIWIHERSGQEAKECLKRVMMSAIGTSIVYFQVFVDQKEATTATALEWG
jgi:hypothetical protein